MMEKNPLPHDPFWEKDFSKLARTANEAKEHTAHRRKKKAAAAKAKAEKMALAALLSRTQLFHFGGDTPDPRHIRENLKSLIEHGEKILKALRGDAPPRRKNAFDRVAAATLKFYRENKRMPTRSDLRIKMRVHPEDIADQVPVIEEKLGWKYPARKPPGRPRRK